MLDSPLVRRLVELAIEEDLCLGDVTSSLTILPDHTSSARVIAREPLVFCGGGLVESIQTIGGWHFEISEVAPDGVLVRDSSTLVSMRGSTRDLLRAERTILNFLQRMSGVATKVRSVVEELGESPVTLLDTRKTLPGWRMLDKYAVRVGGAHNHRMNLGDMVMVKNNHIDAHPGGMRGALAAVVSGKPLYMPWEVEVRSLEELDAALEFRPTVVMLDNFSDQLVGEAMKRIKGCDPRPLVEVSGGISVERVRRLASSGIDAVSMGSLTTAAPNVDISMRIQ